MCPGIPDGPMLDSTFIQGCAYRKGLSHVQYCTPRFGSLLLCVCMLSCVCLFVIPWTVACQAPLSMEFSRQEHWPRLPFPFPGDLLKPGNQTWVSCVSFLGRQILSHCVIWEAFLTSIQNLFNEPHYLLHIILSTWQLSMHSVLIVTV